MTADLIAFKPGLPTPEQSSARLRLSRRFRRSLLQRLELRDISGEDHKKSGR